MFQSKARGAFSMANTVGFFTVQMSNGGYVSSVYVIGIQSEQNNNIIYNCIPYFFALFFDTIAIEPK
jgi:hypothetical protein